MYNTIIINGTQGSGKTTMVKKFCQGKKAVFLNVSPDDITSCEKITEETEVIVFEEFADKKAIKTFSEATHIKVTENGETILIKKPLIIFTMNA